MKGKKRIAELERALEESEWNAAMWRNRAKEAERVIAIRLKMESRSLFERTETPDEAA